MKVFVKYFEKYLNFGINFWNMIFLKIIVVVCGFLNYEFTGPWGLISWRPLLYFYNRSSNNWAEFVIRLNKTFQKVFEPTLDWADFLWEIVSTLSVIPIKHIPNFLSAAHKKLVLMAISSPTAGFFPSTFATTFAGKIG